MIRVSRQTRNEWDVVFRGTDISSHWFYFALFIPVGDALPLVEWSFFRGDFADLLVLLSLSISNSIIFMKINLSWECEAVFRQYSKLF